MEGPSLQTSHLLHTPVPERVGRTHVGGLEGLVVRTFAGSLPVAHGLHALY